jgi:very-short-patch-repair endonuclease
MKLFENITKEDLEKFSINHLLSNDFNSLEKITDKWGFFRQIYMENIPKILEASQKDIKQWSQVYYFDWLSHFSPIEKIAWSSIRETGKIVLYPQFPVFNFFIDFANPFLRLGLELDGKDFHNEHKDFEKDIKLKRFGWKIFRVSGKEANEIYLTNNELDERGIVGKEKKEAIEHWVLNTCDGVINSIKYWYFLTEKERQHEFNFYLNPEEKEEKINFHVLAKLSLEKHNLAKFKI